MSEPAVADSRLTLEELKMVALKACGLPQPSAAEATVRAVVERIAEWIEDGRKCSEWECDSTGLADELRVIARGGR